MKRSDTAPDTQSGKFAVGGKPLGTVTEGMLVRRAKEIAVTRGFKGNDYSPDDYDQARRELTGFSDSEAALENSESPATGDWLTPAGGGSGGKTPVRGAADEQQLGEKLVREGKDEATHHQMLAGNQTSREKDQK